MVMVMTMKTIMVTIKTDSAHCRQRSTTFSKTALIGVLAKTVQNFIGSGNSKSLIKENKTSGAGFQLLDRQEHQANSSSTRSNYFRTSLNDRCDSQTWR